MIEIIFAAVAFVLSVYLAYLVGKDFGREEGFYECHSEA